MSNDNGFKKACKEAPNHFFFGSLGALFDAINKEKEEAYAETINVIKELQFRIAHTLIEYIKSNENIEVRGLSYDKDGVETGFDYDESYLHNVSNIAFRVDSVDEMTDKYSKSLFCVRQTYLLIVILKIMPMPLGIQKLKNMFLLKLLK